MKSIYIEQINVHSLQEKADTHLLCRSANDNSKGLDIMDDIRNLKFSVRARRRRINKSINRIGNVEKEKRRGGFSGPMFTRSFFIVLRYITHH
jgi:hypothetical protein